MTEFSSPPAIVLCADDFGLAPGINTAIVDLILAGRLTATGCMSALPHWREGAPALRAALRHAPADVGLHLTLTDHPALSGAHGIATAGRLPAVNTLLRRALLRALPAAAIASEIDAQLDAFEDLWGQAPDFVDGHQHVHLFPGVREALVAALLRRYPRGSVWVRDCVETPRRCVQRRISSAKALFLSALGLGLRRQLRAGGIPANDGFSGVHDFSAQPPFRTRMQHFLAHSGPRPLLHVHPGRVDAVLRAADSLTTPREWELHYLASADFIADLAAAQLRPGRFADVDAAAR